MRPPECRICDADLDPGGEGCGLLSFKKDARGEAWAARAAAEPGFVGHPPWQDWFCQEHYGPLQALTHLTIREACARLRDGAS